MKKAFRAAIYHCLADPGETGDANSAQYFKDGLLVTDNGVITALGDAADLLAEHPDVDVDEDEHLHDDRRGLYDDHRRRAEAIPSVACVCGGPLDRRRRGQRIAAIALGTRHAVLVDQHLGEPLLRRKRRAGVHARGPAPFTGAAHQRAIGRALTRRTGAAAPSS